MLTAVADPRGHLESRDGPADLRRALTGRRALLVASTGGHLAQIVRWAEVFDLHRDSVFATFDSEQSRSLLAGRRVITLPYVPPRGGRALLAATVELVRQTRDTTFDVVLSTGAGLSLAGYAVARLRRLGLVYIESVSRFEGPSTSGRILERLPRVDRYCQHASWADRPGWRRGPSLLDDFTAQRLPEVPTGPRTVFVSLGTIRPYRFDALVDAVLGQLSADHEVTWQLGTTHRDDLPGVVRPEIPAEEFDRLVADSGVFITHAGVGTLLRALELGVRPVVVPRRAVRGEHVDDHQLQVAEDLARRGLVVLRHPDQLSAEDLERSGVVIRRTDVEPGATVEQP